MLKDACPTGYLRSPPISWLYAFGFGVNGCPAPLSSTFFTERYSSPKLNGFWMNPLQPFCRISFALLSRA